MENDDGDDDDMEGQADAQPPAEVEQPPGNPPREAAEGRWLIKAKNMTNPLSRKFQE